MTGDPARAEAWWPTLRGWLTSPARTWGRGDTGVIAVLTLATAFRWPLRSRTLLSWDGTTFALALERYDMNALRPHAPGYPLFVLLGRLFNLVLPDHNEALVALSLAFTALALGLAYALARHLLHRAAGLTLATVLMATPLVFVHSVTANVYTADLACSLAVAWTAWRCHAAPSARRALVLAAVLAVAVGIRPSQALFLTPLAAWGALRPPWALREQWLRLRWAVATGVAIGLAWFLPMAHLSGGITAWRTANQLQSDQIVFADTVVQHGWPIVRENLDRLATFLRWELAWVLPVVAAIALLGLAAAARPRRSASFNLPGPTAGRATGFFVAWATPGFLFYALVFDGWGNGPSGYALVLLPAFLMAGLLVANVALAALRTSAPALAVAVVALAAIGTSTSGLAAHLHDVEDVNYREHDAWSEAWAGLPEAFPASNTTIVALWNFAHVWYSFPDYTSYNYRAPRNGPGEAPDFLMIQIARNREATPDWYSAVAAGPQPPHYPLPNGTENLILFDFQLAGENGGERQVRDDVPVQDAVLPNGWRVLYLKVEPGKGNLEDYFTMEGALPST